MKRALAITTILFIFLSTVGFGIYIYSKKNMIKKVESINFPNIDALTLEGKNVSTRIFSESTSAKVFVFFDPDCEHCTFQIEDMVKNKALFNNLKVIFISPASYKKLEQFVQQMNIDSTSFTVLSTTFEEILKKIEFKVFPSTYIFNETNKPIKAFIGECSSQIIRKEIGYEKR